MNYKIKQKTGSSEVYKKLPKAYSHFFLIFALIDKLPRKVDLSRDIQA